MTESVGAAWAILSAAAPRREATIAQATAARDAIRSTVGRRRQAELAKARADHEQDVAAAGQDAEAAVIAAKARAEELTRELAVWDETSRRRLEDAVESRRRKIKHDLDHAVWQAEAIHEEAIRIPVRDLEAYRSHLQARVAELEGLMAQARAFVKRCRMRMPPEPGLDAAAAAQAGAQPETAIMQQTEVVRGLNAQLGRLWLPGLFRGPILLAPWFLFAAIGAGVGALLNDGVGGMPGRLMHAAYGAAGGTLLTIVLAFVAYLVGRRKLHAALAPSLQASAIAHAAMKSAMARAEGARRQKEELVTAQRDESLAEANAKFGPLLDELEARRAEKLATIEQTVPLKRTEIANRRAAQLNDAQVTRDVRVARAARALESSVASIDDRARAEVLAAESAWSQACEAERAAWCTARDEAEGFLAALCAADAALFTPWDALDAASWVPERTPGPAARVGHCTLDLATIPGALPTDPVLAWPAELPTALRIPVALGFPSHASLLLECGHEGRAQGVAMLQQAMLRVLTAMPPGKVRFTIVDPVGLGEGFASFMHLADEHEQLIGERIWTDHRHIEQKLTDLSEHMETVIQKYLRNEFASIEDYNRQAGEIAEPLRVLVFCDFPANLTEAAAKRLAGIVNSGARCGVHTMILRDERLEWVPGIDQADLRARSLCLQHREGRWGVTSHGLEGLPFDGEWPPAAERLIPLLRRIGKAAKEGSRVEVPFEMIAPKPDALWSGSTATSVQVPLGRTGATRLQMMTLGVGTSQHALIAGKTGSGKSTLLHALITNLALWYSPDEVEFYLVDFKKGVEFKTYATHRLPHARVVAVESDREFGLSVLQGLDGELKRRGDLYRQLGVQDLASYRRTGHPVVLPRVLLIIDEFQELFIEDDRIAQDANLLLDRLVRQGRAFGMHVVLGSQTLSGAFSLARTTMGQMGVRIALQCSEADSQVILSDENLAARLLSRPGEAIYNDAGGLLEGNSPFQVVWLPDQVREQWLNLAQMKAQAEPPKRPLETIIFEGNAPASLEANPVLAGRCPPGTSPLAPSLWLGEAIAIKDPTAIRLRRMSGANTIVVGQRDDAAQALCASSLLSLAAQAPGARVVLLDGTTADDPTYGALEALGRSLGLDIVTATPREMPERLQELAAEVASRQQSGAADGATILLIAHGLHRMRALRRNEDDYGFGGGDAPPTPDKLFIALAREGPAVGVHVLATVDTATNMGRVLDRNGLREFDNRVLFQMSATDSSTMVDSPAASRLGPERAMLYNEELGIAEKFRFYAWPDPRWLEAAAARLRGGA